MGSAVGVVGSQAFFGRIGVAGAGCCTGWICDAATACTEIAGRWTSWGASAVA